MQTEEHCSLLELYSLAAAVHRPSRPLTTGRAFVYAIVLVVFAADSENDAK
jgi:hypothetical protein